MYIFVGVQSLSLAALSLSHPLCVLSISRFARHVFAPGDRKRHKHREREGKKIAHNLIPLTLLFFLVSAQEWQHQQMFVISFPLCQNDNSKDKMPFILYFLFSVIQF